MTLPSLIEKGRAEFNEMFLYGMGIPLEGSLELTHNNVRDFLETYAKEVFNAAFQAGKDAVKKENPDHVLKSEPYKP